MLRCSLFDLVVKDGVNPDLYVALDVETGVISLVSSSTNGVAQDGKCTTVFGVSCRGSLLLVYGSTTYVWTTTDSSTVATPRTAATTEGDTLNTMLLLPARVRTPLDQGASTSTTRRRRSQQQPGMTPWKRDMSQWGVAQRCPKFNSKMVAVSNGRSGSAPNGCGPDGSWYSMIVPNLGFGGCCNTHDRYVSNRTTVSGLKRPPNLPRQCSRIIAQGRRTDRKCSGATTAAPITLRSATTISMAV